MGQSARDCDRQATETAALVARDPQTIRNWVTAGKVRRRQRGRVAEYHAGDLLEEAGLVELDAQIAHALNELRGAAVAIQAMQGQLTAAQERSAAFEVQVQQLAGQVRVLRQQAQQQTQQAQQVEQQRRQLIALVRDWQGHDRVAGADGAVCRPG